MRWAKGRGGPPSFHRIFYFGGGSIVFFFFFFFLNWSIKLAHFKKKRKEVRLVTHPQLINVKQNTYPHYKLGVLIERCMQTS
jgi:hypothetical protein